MIVATAAGNVQGRTVEANGGSCVQFRNVPFAAPTGGQHRFRPARPVQGWDGVRDCTVHGPTAPQPPSPVASLLGGADLGQSEDCLSLTVTTPALDGSRPVMVWIHGGGFIMGTGASPGYDGASLATRGNVVVVSINYRLGALGFLHLHDVLGPDYADSGSVGVGDQITALEWVRDNIGAFGGDPTRVTIFGESAGGMSVGALLGSPRASGLFQTAIAQSGACHNVSTADQSAEVTAALLGELGIGAGDAEQLLEIDVDTLMAAQASASMKLLSTRGMGGVNGGGLPYQPVWPSSTLPQHPLEGVRAGAAAGVRVIAGSTADEWTIFAMLMGASGQVALDSDSLRTRLEQTFGDRADDIVATYSKNRPNATPQQVFGAVLTDFVFRIPAIRLLEAQLDHNSDVYLYEFAHRSTAFGGNLGACHGIDVPFVFDNLADSSAAMFLGDIGDRERALADEVASTWTAAARGEEPWERYEPSKRATRRFGGDSAGLHSDPAADERSLWDGLR